MRKSHGAMLKPGGLEMIHAWSATSSQKQRSALSELLWSFSSFLTSLRGRSETKLAYGPKVPEIVHVSITNPGTIGTVQSVPRLMPGQGVIVGVGSIEYPAEFQGSDEANLNTLGISKVVTVTSTYDHRIIQGAESGLFLKRVHELLLGKDNFYDNIFRSLDIPYIAVKWSSDASPINREEALMEKQMQVATVVRVHRVRGHLIADIDPLRWNAPELPKELDPATYGLTIWDLEREFLTGGVAGSHKMKLDELLGVLRDAYCRTIGIEYMHIQDTDEQRWIQSKVEGVTFTPTLDKKLRVLERLNAAEAPVLNGPGIRSGWLHLGGGDSMRLRTERSGGGSGM